MIQSNNIMNQISNMHHNFPPCPIVSHSPDFNTITRFLKNLSEPFFKHLIASNHIPYVIAFHLNCLFPSSNRNKNFFFDSAKSALHCAGAPVIRKWSYTTPLVTRTFCLHFLRLKWGSFVKLSKIKTNFEEKSEKSPETWHLNIYL